MEFTEENLEIEYNKTLKKYFGYDKLKKEQFEIIRKIIHDKIDIFAILCTSFGKSITFQMTHLISKNNVIVISPLLSLINDQYEQMKKNNINVCKFNSDLSKTELLKQKKEILNGAKKLIYVTPEWLIKSLDFIKELNNLGFISLIAIDEAHCVSSWSDFRESYKTLSMIREEKELGNIPMLCLTATASKHIQNDVMATLKLKNPLMIIGDFDRKNLYIEVNKRNDSTIIKIVDIINNYRNDHNIIYCISRKDTEKLKEILLKNDIKCENYHAGMDSVIRNDIQRKVMNGEIKCIIATIAYAQGINISNVRNVIHYSACKSIENYYQEIGRAGRDGLESYCYLFYSPRDFIIHKIQLKESKDEEFIKYQQGEIIKMENYVNSNHCRRKSILEHFGQICNGCDKCDNCTIKKKIITVKNYVYQTYLFLSLLKKLNGKYGGKFLIKIIVGKCEDNDLIKLDEFDKGRKYGTIKWWESFINVLKLKEYITYKKPDKKNNTNKFVQFLFISNKANTWINNMKNKYNTFNDLVNNIVQEDYLYFEEF